MAGDLRLTYSQFHELESFARFGAHLDEETERTLARGRRVREALQQPQNQPLPVAEQIAVLLAASEGVFDELEPEAVIPTAAQLRQHFVTTLPELANRIEEGEVLQDEDREKLLQLAREVVADGTPQRREPSDPRREEA